MTSVKVCPVCYVASHNAKQVCDGCGHGFGKMPTIERIRKLSNEGKTLSQIADALGKSTAHIRRLSTLHNIGVKKDARKPSDVQVARNRLIVFWIDKGFSYREVKKKLEERGIKLSIDRIIRIAQEPQWSDNMP